MTDVSKSPRKIASMFDAIAARYDVLNHLLSAGIDKRWRARAIRSLRLTGRERLLDVCTGTADVAIAARTAAPAAARVVGVDFADAMLRVGVRKLRDRALDGVALVRADASRLPIADRSVDAVTIAFGIRNVDDRAAACREMHRVLAPGGRLAVLEFATPRAPLFGALYTWYSTRILPRIGRAISGHEAAYDYLPASVAAFSSPDEFMKLLRQCGFVDVTAVPLTLGVVFLYVGSRPAS